LYHLKTLIKNLTHHKIKVILSGTNPKVYPLLEKEGIIDLLAEDAVIDNFEHALQVSEELHKK